MNLDQLLNLIALLGWLFFAVFAIVLFTRTLLRSGFGRAVIELLSGRVLIPLFLAICLSLLSAALVFVQPTEVAVVVSIISPGGVRPQPIQAGLHFIVPVLENEVKYSIAWQTYTMAANVTEGKGDDSIRARTNDGQEVRLASSIIFRVNQEQVVTLHIDWQQRYVEDFVRPVVRGVVRTQVSQFDASEVNSSARRDLEATLERLLREEFAAKGLLVDQFVLRDITFTPEYAMAVELKQVALEDEQRALHEAQQVRNRAEGQRDKVRLEAEGQRDRLALEAEGKAQAILTEAQAQAQALQLIGEALQKNPNLLTYEYINKLSPNIRAMLVPNNAPLILPLPDLDQFAPPTATLTTTQPVTTSAAPDAGSNMTR
ncbi:MAG: prohibitin family protein [Caldilinea sp. CFX5]|nr:prohibitin family protein [Caldilinea sp. CFX5]